MEHPNRNPSQRSAPNRGFTLVELLVTIAILAVLATLAVVATRSAKLRAQEAACTSNMRNLGVALQLYCNDHNGRYPETKHTADFDRAWVFALEQYLGDYDKTRVCPADPLREERLAAGGTSYILNSFVFVPKYGPWGNLLEPARNRPAALPDLSRTILAFICSDAVGVGPGNDHTHSGTWHSWGAVCSEIAPGRFGGEPGDPFAVKGRSNYLYADGSVRSIQAGEIKQRIDSGINIAAIPGLE